MQNTSLKYLITSMVKNRFIIWQMTKRNVIGKYKGSFLGVVWSFLNPLILLFIYTFAFSVVFKAKWGLEEEGHLDFALILFASLTIFNLFGDTLRDSPNLVLNYPNYVKKIIFPLEILPIVNLCTSLIQAGINLIIFIFFFLMTNFYLPLTIFLIPFIIFPLILIALGVSFFLASFGVYFRDIGYFMGHVITIFLFTSPVFYSMERIPKSIQKFTYINPIAIILENARSVMIFGKYPNWSELIFYSILGFVLLISGFWWFQKTRVGFSDVL